MVYKKLFLAFCLINSISPLSGIEIDLFSLSYDEGNIEIKIAGKTIHNKEDAEQEQAKLVLLKKEIELLDAEIIKSNERTSEKKLNLLKKSRSMKCS